MRIFPRLALVAVILSSISSLAFDPKRLKVAFVIDTIDMPKSGAIVSAQRFAAELKDLVDLRIITTGDTKGDQNRTRLRGFYFPFVKETMKRNGFKFAYPDKALLLDAFKDADLVYVHFPFYLGFKAVQWARELHKPVVVGFHLQPENILHNIGIHSQMAVRKLYSVSVNNFYNMADYIICPSPFSEGILKAIPTFKSETVVISNGLTRSFRPNRKQKPLIYEDAFVILTVGRLSQEKNHITIIDAIAESKYKDKIQLIATGDGAMKEELIARSRQKGILARFGYVSSEELISLYNSSDLYIHASEIELEGMSILEAIGTGLPAIISDSKESASKQFALNPDFLFQNRNHKELASKIDYWFENEQRLKEVGHEYAKSAEKYYIEASVARVLETFQQAVAKNQARLATKAVQ